MNYWKHFSVFSKKPLNNSGNNNLNSGLNNEKINSNYNQFYRDLYIWVSFQPNSTGNYFVNVKVFEKLTGLASKSFSKCLFLGAKYVLNLIFLTFYHIILIGQVSCKYFIQKIVLHLLCKSF